VSDDQIVSEERRADIFWLLRHRNDHLPVEVRSASPVAAPGFVGGSERRLSCPDCLTNGRPMAGCETCGGRGEIPDPGPDPYANNEAVLPFGFNRERHDQSHERDRKIEMLQRQTRPAPTEAELLEEANRRGYAWEEERRAMYRQYDFAALDRALDELRAHYVDAAHAVNAVYVDGWLVEIGQITPLFEELCERGLAFLSDRLPDPPRTGLHPAMSRQRARRSAA
jgi:hypothetical protein